ncbi:Gfo/Idh/MocA family oxidoreductase [Rathayibacter sp. VKM Ac-2805]|uniref:Gfo/Idh/MocA family protein n=1 Tax=Rathayibacter sp. VKM Ac-2805 TaxID=2609258 RepID=UPI00131F85A9|nr:Gfo/Idh/MocA family oxidoreductase [Rathayibacter sp. VKM Ac-2805]QHC75039.1 Gfo/Idh/MocA family oxidoreductase [Rathayibacter sp. VKM Ac-2805]
MTVAGARGRVPIAVVGAGMSGLGIHLPLIRSVPGLELVAVVAHSAPGRERTAPTGVPLVGSIEDLADVRPRPAVAVVATPDRLHVEHVSALLDAGIGAVVEKPLADTPERARLLAARAVETGLPLIAFLNRRWDGDFLTLRSVLEQGLVGEPVLFESTIARWIEGAAPGWRGEALASGVDGVLGGFGSHLVDQAVALFGPVDRVYAEVGRRRAASAVPDDALLMLRHAGGMRSHLRMTMVSSVEQPRFRLQGLAGALEKHGFDGQQDALVRRGEDPLDARYGIERAELWGSLHTADGARPVETLPGEWRAFYVGLAEHLNGGPAPVPLDDAVHGLDVLHAARRSADSGGSVRVER